VYILGVLGFDGEGFESVSDYEKPIMGIWQAKINTNRDN
jgi:hypothetical protein